LPIGVADTAKRSRPDESRVTRLVALLLLASLLAGCASPPEESDGNTTNDQADEGLSADFVATDDNSTGDTNSTGDANATGNGDGTSKA
jgi:hypothetical protein